MKNPSVVVCGYYGFGNAGDEALLLSLLQRLPGSVHPIVLSRTPTLTAQTYSVEAISRRNGWQVIEALRLSSAFIWGGGSLLQDRTSWRSPLFYAGLMGLAQQQKLTTIAWAQGVGPLERRWVQELSRRCLQGCTAVSVRDPTTQKLMRDWQIEALMAPDPVWALDPMSLADSFPHPCMAVVLRSHRHLTPARLQALTQGLVAFQKASQLHLLLVPFQLPPDPTQTDQLGSDYQLAFQIQQHLPDHSQIVLLRDPRQLMGLFQTVQFTLTMRYHGLVMAAAGGSVCFGLSYDPKVSQLLTSLQMPGWELEQIPTDPAEIARQWLAAYEAGRSLSDSEITDWRQAATDHATLLQDYLA